MFIAEIRIPLDPRNEMVSSGDRSGRSVIVGFAEVCTTSDFCFKLGEHYPFKEFRPKINSLVVQKEFRSMGIGMQLLAACVAQARLWGHEDIMLEVRDDNVRGIRFYQRMGFTENLRKHCNISDFVKTCYRCKDVGTKIGDRSLYAENRIEAQTSSDLSDSRHSRIVIFGRRAAIDPIIEAILYEEGFTKNNKFE